MIKIRMIKLEVKNDQVKKLRRRSPPRKLKMIK